MVHVKTIRAPVYRGRHLHAGKDIGKYRNQQQQIVTLIEKEDNVWHVQQAPLKEHGILRGQLQKKLAEHSLPLVGVVPHDPLISSVRLDEIQAALCAKVIAGRKGPQDLTVDKVRSSNVLNGLHVNTCLRRTIGKRRSDC